MKNKNLNKFFDIISIVMIFIFLIHDIIINNLKYDYILIAVILDTLYTFSYVVFAMLGVIILFNIILFIANKKKLVLIILRLLNIVLLSVTLYFSIRVIYGVDSLSAFPRVILFLLLMIINALLFIINRNIEFNNKFSKVLLVLYSILGVGFIIFITIGSIIIKVSDVKAGKFITSINNGIIKNMSFLIPAKNEKNKWGCLDSYGREKIEFEYDSISVGILSRGDYYCIPYYVLAKKDNKYYYINNAGEVIYECKNYPLPFDNFFKGKEEYTNSEKSIAFFMSLLIESCDEELLFKKENNNSYEIEKTGTDFDTYENSYANQFDLGNNYNIDIIKNDNSTYRIVYKHFNEVLLDCDNVLIKDYYGDIPVNRFDDILFSDENSIAGYINVQDYTYNTFNCKTERLYSINDYVYYYDLNEELAFLKDKKTKQLKDIYSNLFEYGNYLLAGNSDGTSDLLDFNGEKMLLNVKDIIIPIQYDKLLIIQDDDGWNFYNLKGKKMSQKSYSEISCY